jgi:four helix bundle protein
MAGGTQFLQSELGGASSYWRIAEARVGIGRARSKVMKSTDLCQRTAAFAVSIVKFSAPLFRRPETRGVAEQLVDAARSVAANYRAACRARSHAEFTAKMGTVLEEADESQFWLQHLRDARLVDATAIVDLDEATQLVAIFTKTRDTAQRNEDIAREARRRPTRRSRK